MTEAAASNPSGGRTAGGIGLYGPARLLSDERLARRATAGDRAAFEEIFRRYHQDLYRFCLATAGNVQDAQDALQNTMVKVMRALPGEERQIKLKPWLYRIARNESVETVRRRRDSAELGASQTAASWEIAETAAARERLRGLFSDLEELPERQRAALTMRELGGLGFEEIGQAFETTPAVARQTLYEARQSLRQMEEGREMSCDTVRRALSDADGRVTRRRDLRAHLRGCADCRAFRDGIADRRGELAAIAPLPMVTSAGLLHGLLDGQTSAAIGGGAGAASVAASAGGGAGGAGGLAGTIGAGAGKVVATSAVVKSAATVAVVAAVGVSADRGGVIDIPLTSGGKASQNASETAPSLAPNERAAREPGPASALGAKANRAQGQDAGQGVTSKGVAGSQLSGAKGRPADSGRPNRSSTASPAGGQARGNSGGGNSQAGTGGPPQSMPPAAGQGQGTAAAHKPSPATSSPSRGGEPSARSTPAQPVRPSKPESAPAAPPVPESTPAEPPAASNSGGAAKGAGAAPVEVPHPELSVLD